MNANLKDHEIVALLTRIEPPTNKERDLIIQSSHGLIISCAKRYRSSMEWDDLIQEGMVGLTIALSKFNPARENKFSTYAMWWIRRYIANAVAAQNKRDGHEVLTKTGHMEDLNAEAANEVDYLLILLENLLSTHEISEKDFFIIKSRFYLENTLQEIATDLQLTRQRIDQLEKHILSQIESKLLDK